MSLLEVAGVSRAFGGNRAVDNVSFQMDVDTLAIVGPNGAGKTTLLNLIAGLLHPDQGSMRFRGSALEVLVGALVRDLRARGLRALVDRAFAFVDPNRSGPRKMLQLLAGVLHPNQGSIRFRGRDVARLPSWRIARLGMVKTYQVVRPFRSLTVEENLILFSRLRGPADLEEILRETGLLEVRDRLSGELPFGLLKRLELAKGLATRPDLLLLDEPIGGLSRSEAQALIATLQALKARGVRMIVVEHRLSEILPLVDRVLALDRGRIIFHGTRSEFYHDPAVRTAYLGSADAAG